MIEYEASGFAEFVRARYSGLARTAFLLTGDRGLAEDLVQTALASTFRRWDRIAPEAADAYTRTTLVRLGAKSRRRRWQGEIPTESFVGRSTPDSSMADIERALDLRNALRTLSWEHRAVLVLRFFDDLSELETAAVLGCSPGTVKSRTSRALARLRSALPEVMEAKDG